MSTDKRLSIRETNAAYGDLEDMAHALREDIFMWALEDEKPHRKSREELRVALDAYIDRAEWLDKHGHKGE
ncbi:hypothetical protein [Streptomyces buecherae]|uniref:hypothetical protein n=1 Tax=Streptomyces buecherae TaxID=2763006 RepID=UPI00164D0423|nr:hypothetical protein [Streptomyces buecherae]QNJ42007.1 hypothetical protein H7H31_21235 [Streptomyces buecherae]